MTSASVPTSPTPSAPVQRPPAASGSLRWIRVNLLRTPLDALLTVIVGVVAVSGLAQFVGWVTTQAQWAVVTVNFRTLMQGLYPIDQSWRVALSVLLIALMAGLSWGLWGRLFRSHVIVFLVGVVVVVGIPAADRTSLAQSSPIGRYLGEELVPLLDVLQGPVLILIATLIAGYGAGRLAKRVNRVRSRQVALVLWFVLIPLVFLLVAGIGVPPLPSVSTNRWGGLLLTFMIAIVTIAACFPLGILLALGRVSGGGTRPAQAKLLAGGMLNPVNWGRVVAAWWAAQGNYPLIKLFCVVFIEFMRGVPLVTVFFTASVIVPIALGGISVDPVIRAMIGMTLFEAAYIAEIVRGGLQALPPGQLEAAKSIGLNPVYATLFITLPQALRLVIPSLVGQFITILKDTSLAIIIGLLEFLGQAQSLTAQPQFQERRREALVFVFVVYFVFSYGMSYAARQLERSGSGSLNRQLR
jgi:general L-amino acid transport system permease protein